MISASLARLFSVPSLLPAVYLSVVAPARASTAPREGTAVRVYLVNIHGKGLGCGGGLVAVNRGVKPTPAPVSASLRLLLADRRPCGNAGLCSALARSRLQLRRVVVVRGMAIVHLTGRLFLGGACDIPRVRGQLRATALQFPSVRAGAVYVNSRPLDRVLSQR